MTDRHPHSLLVFVFLALAFFAVADLHAYVDPGSASYLFQMIAGGVLGGMFVIRSYWTRIREAFTRQRRSHRVGE